MTRKQRPRGTTTREAVVNAALAVADRDGLDALTIRSVAERVEAPPMSLYTHFANKDELLDLMYAEIARRMYADDGHPTWQGALRALCHRVRAILSDHPHWVGLITRSAPGIDIPVRERVLALMGADGMSATEAFRAFSSTALFAIGLVLMEQTLGGPDHQSALQKRFTRLKAWAESEQHEQAVTRSAVKNMSRFDFDDNFAFAVAAYIAGLDANRDAASTKSDETALSRLDDGSAA
jgi:AcrR family transcriptional regulator